MNNSTRVRRHFSAALLCAVGLWGLFIGGKERIVGALALAVGLICWASLFAHDKKLKRAEEKARLEQEQGEVPKQ